ncbi:MAG TPA: CPBP family intramembrane glutamic endopeptidase [Acidimicrobiia bacterium]|nr:CPBP family intramembrane glutamic endopeptidase [Acidimicrobiia bacterium]
MSPRRAIRTALVILGAHNLVQNTVLNERGYVTGNLVVSGLLVGVGRASGLGWEEMGLHPGDVRRGLRIGGWASAAMGTVALLALGHPRARALLRDERATGATARAVWRRALLRFPVGTALFEEVAFRGVVPALFRQTHHPVAAEALAGAVFAAWHVIPTGRALAGNPLRLELPRARRILVIGGGSVVAGTATIPLGWARRVTGGLLAPWLIHSSFNSLSYLAAVAAMRGQRS